MNLTPYPRDANGKPLPECGSEAFNERITIGTDPIDLRFAVDCKAVSIYLEPGSDNLTITGLQASGVNKGSPLAAGIVDLAADAAVDAGGGIVTLKTMIAHNFAVGSSIKIAGRYATVAGESVEVYAGDFVVKAGSVGTTLNIQATYVDESSGVDASGDVEGVHSGVYADQATLIFPLALEARTKFLRCVSAGATVLSIQGYR